MFKRKRQSTWLDAVTTPVDKEQMNCCVPNHLVWRDFKHKSPKKNGNAFSNAVLMSDIQNLAAVFSFSTAIKIVYLYAAKKKPHFTRFI